MSLSEKQKESYRESTKRLNFWEGAVRSGKTFISIVRFMKALKQGPPGHAMIIGVSRDSIQRNIISELCALVGAPVPTPKTTQLNLFGRIIFLVGANDERAQRRIQGSTLAMAYVDELTLIPHGFFRMLLSRLSVAGAQLFGTTNPDSPFHWLKTDYLSKDNLDMSVFKFKLDDNPSLTKDYIDNLKREYSGLWYKRYIDGDWVLAEGTVYDFFNEETDVLSIPPGPAEYYIIGIDYGTANPTAFTLFGYSRKLYPNVWLEREYYYDSRANYRQKTDTETVEDLIKFIGEKNVRLIIVDPSAASFKAEMHRQGISGVVDADNDVINGIRYVSTLINNGTFKVCRCCENTIREFQTYRWDEKAGLKGEDKPIKEFDHCFIAGTSITTEFGQIPIQNVKVGTRVKTRSGWNKVLKTFQRKAKVETFSVLGKQITCTPSHKFFTLNGWKEAANLIPSDMLFIDMEVTCKSKKSNLAEENIGVIQDLKRLISEITTDVAASTLPTAFDISIETFGNRNMEKYHPDTIFITKMGIPQTIALAISNASILKSMFPSIGECLQINRKKILESMLKESVHFQKNGMEVKKEENGIKLMGRDAGKKGQIKNTSASNAETHFLQNPMGQISFVRINVSLNGEEKISLIMRSDNALFADKNSKQTSTLKQNVVENLVPPKGDGLIDVYNLHVENEHEFFAEGILVSNCLDSLRYALYTHFRNVLTGECSGEDIDKIYADVIGAQTELPDFFRDTGNQRNHNASASAVGFF